MSITKKNIEKMYYVEQFAYKIQAQNKMNPSMK